MVCADVSHRAEDGARMAQIPASLVVAVVAGMAPLAAQTSLSIYSDGRVVVRRTLPQPLEKGRNTLTLKLEGLDPATLFSPDTAVAFVSATRRRRRGHGARHGGPRRAAAVPPAGRALPLVRAWGAPVPGGAGAHDAGGDRDA